MSALAYSVPRPGIIRTNRPGDVFRMIGEETTRCEAGAHCRCPRHDEHCCQCGEPKGAWWK